MGTLRCVVHFTGRCNLADMIDNGFGVIDTQGLQVITIALTFSEQMPYGI